MKKVAFVLSIFTLLFVFTGTALAQWPPTLIGTIQGSQDENLGDACRRLAKGDVNDDGYTDLIVGSWNKGLVHIFFGDEIGIDPEPDITLTGFEPGGVLGAAGLSVSCGDLNNDGYDDVVVGDYVEDADDIVDAGKACVYHGGSPMDTIADLTLTSEYPVENGWFGITVTCGHFDTDPYADVAIAASREHVYGSKPCRYPGVMPAIPTYNGIIYLFRGGDSMDSAADLIIAGEASSGKAGEKDMDACDVNGDGYNDLLVGSYGARYHHPEIPTLDMCGNVNLYLGGSRLDFAPDIRIPKQDLTQAELFGYTMSTGGDINGDGYDDLLVGRYAGGRLYIYFGLLRCLDPDLTFEAPAGASKANWAKEGTNELGDINNDGYDDFIISGYKDNWDDGVAYIFLGGDTIGNYLTLDGESGYASWFSFASLALGDINDDGIDDFLIAAPKYGDSQGKLYIYAGNEEISGGSKAVFCLVPIQRR